MMNLLDNAYNRRVERSQSKLKLWRYAGLMLTYQCSAACAFCYYGCGPDKGGLMPVDTALAAWQALIRLAGTNARVHLTGGEPFLVFDRLAEITRLAHQQGLTGLEYIETNASWAKDPADIREKLKYLAAHGMEKIKISCDPFHLEYVPAESIQKLRDIALDVLGPDRVMVRWEHWLQKPVSFSGLTNGQKQDIYRQAIQEDPCRLTGRAAFLLADLLPQHAPAAFAGKHCAEAILAAKGVHIDPSGNVFIGQCSGMVAGAITQTPLDVMWREFDPANHPFWNTLLTAGPCGWLGQPVSEGYDCRPGYATKCHLCSDLRRFFFDKNTFWPIIGPRDCYYI